MREIFWAIQYLSPRWKVFGGLALLIVLSGIITASSLIIDSWQSRKFEKKRSENEIKVWATEQKAKEFENLANKYKAQNDLLKTQNEAQAEILKANDQRLNADAQNLTKILEQRKTTNEKISNSADDYDYQRCELCRECERSGYKLSANYCRGCENTPQNSSGK
jgi:hypothetical protein